VAEHRRGNDDEFYAAVDFGDNPGPESGASAGDYDSGVFADFGDEVGGDTAEDSVFDALVTDDAGVPSDAGSGVAAVIADIEEVDSNDEEFAKTLATVTNPSETVSVTAMMDGTIHRVDLLADAARMTESGLAQEILVIADLARQQALSIQHTLLFDTFRILGANDEEALAEMLESGVSELRSPRQAAEAQAEVFATRYVSDDGGAPAT
jgi:hypothetical protein